MCLCLKKSRNETCERLDKRAMILKLYFILLYRFFWNFNFSLFSLSDCALLRSTTRTAALSRLAQKKKHQNRDYLGSLRALSRNSLRSTLWALPGLQQQCKRQKKSSVEMKTSFVHPVCMKIYKKKLHNVKHEQKQKWECWKNIYWIKN